MQRDHLLIAEMIEAAGRIVEIVGSRSAEQMLADDMRRDALLWNFTVLGEAAAQVSDELKGPNEIGWSNPMRLRNRIVHGYWSVDMSVLVATAINDLPDMLTALNQIQDSIIADN